ncbi:hypothetical protein QBC46DRAFT_268572 [Diplogelasinospora grovesii]|uniref:HNH nuclease domain-containing protein n=1 Tax=Diplogelasinospora grovesii TaxID=303347 RepID=A0AAN6N0L7_9PEZI|nr:hypothetical protein QBC46DRAFT_268572 [Diplogelasinospora grovesii]
MAAHEMKDPLSGIIIRSHPAPEVPEVATDGTPESAGLPASSVLSSHVSEPEIFYDRMRKAEMILDKYESDIVLDDTPRLLYHTIHNLPQRGSIQMINEILWLGGDNDKLRQLRNFFVDAVLKPIGATAGQTVVPSHPTGRALEIDQLMSEKERLTRNDQEALKQKCLRRDGYHCLITQKFDAASCTDGLYQRKPGELGGFTQCCHILPFALRKFNEENSMEVEAKATIWWALYRYFPALRGKIGSSTINQEGNALTMVTVAHEYFGLFAFSIQPTDVKNVYQTHTYESYYEEELPKFLTFISHDQSVPAPDGDFLNTHYVIGKILHVIGLINKFPRIRGSPDDNIINLRQDGSTDLGKILSRRLLMDW